MSAADAALLAAAEAKHAAGVMEARRDPVTLPLTLNCLPSSVASSSLGDRASSASSSSGPSTPPGGLVRPSPLVGHLIN